MTEIKPDGAELAAIACQTLKADGWIECQDMFRKYATCLYKRFDTPTRCACNDDKPGMQVCVAVSHHDKFMSYEIDLTGELLDGSWIKLHNYSLRQDIEKGLATIPKLLATWEFIATNTKPTE